MFRTVCSVRPRMVFGCCVMGSHSPDSIERCIILVCELLISAAQLRRRHLQCSRDLPDVEDGRCSWSFRLPLTRQLIRFGNLRESYKTFNQSSMICCEPPRVTRRVGCCEAVPHIRSHIVFWHTLSILIQHPRLVCALASPGAAVFSYYCRMGIPPLMW